MLIEEDYKNVSVFAIESQSEDESTWERSVQHTQMYMQLFPLYILPLFNVFRNANDCASQVMQLYDSQPTIYSANESLNAITSVIVYIFAYGSKIVLFSFTGNWRDMGYLHRNFSGFLSTVSTYVMYHSLGL